MNYNITLIYSSVTYVSVLLNGPSIYKSNLSRGKSSLYHSQSPKLHFCQIGLIISWYWLVTYHWTPFTQHSVFHKDNVTQENLLVVKLNFLKQIWTSTNWKFNRHYHHLFHPLSALFRYHKLESKRNPPLKAMGINVYEKGLEVMLLCSLPVQHSHDKIILAVQDSFYSSNFKHVEARKLYII